ncbi:RWD domain-containing protein 4 [Adelges cooleyi]|uniref:RWD domain-containing protein 4 n=1 Tax=Adelges cooleyi TaxID=133065 RepID=UPI00217F92D6|nr:RWD domain-containing protein 4 [Adelges cooleyi]XP_050420476.1 RWD domain-containing protein 4 [Adelges cooleyi]
MADECSVLQEEEREALLSIYDGDEAFKEVSPTIYQYKYGEDDDNKSFLLEIEWHGNYPNEAPKINLDTFYNRHIVSSVKQNILDKIATEANHYLGESMTFTLFEFIKDISEELVAEQPTKEVIESMTKLTIDNDEDITKKVTVKKDHMSKAQKRKQWDRLDSKGDKPRGFDWIDVVKHLSQTGSSKVEIST